MSDLILVLSILAMAAVLLGLKAQNSTIRNLSRLVVTLFLLACLRVTRPGADTTPVGGVMLCVVLLLFSLSSHGRWPPLFSDPEKQS